MKAAATLLALLLPVVTARFVAEGEPNLVNLSPPDGDGAAELYLIETAPGETSWVTEEQKWELRRNGRRFFDITDSAWRDQPQRVTSDKKSVFPKKVTLQDEVNPLLKNLSKSNIQEHLEKFTSFHTRYYKSEYGKQSSAWLLKTIQDTIKHADAYKHGVEAVAFEHPWGQSSIIARIPGKTNSTVVIAAHQDSINLWLPSVLAAPGADDDGSGTVTILEAFRTILLSDYIVKGEGLNTLEFHWYSAEEGGLLGSQAVFEEYAATGRDVKAMLQQDMTGFVQRTLEAGKPESLGIMVDFVDPNLTEFIKKVIVAYTQLPFVETKCGYACSDHASALKVGYPSACVTESAFEYTDNHIHTVDDRISYLSFAHMLQHARMTVGFVYELAFTDFKKLEAESDWLPEMPEDEKIIDL